MNEIKVKSERDAVNLSEILLRNGFRVSIKAPERIFGYPNIYWTVAFEAVERVEDEKC